MVLKTPLKIDYCSYIESIITTSKDIGMGHCFIYLFRNILRTIQQNHASLDAKWYLV